MVAYEKFYFQYECIPVGCVQSAAVAARGVYPSMHWAGVCVSQHALGKGCLPGGVCPGVGCLPGGRLPGGVSAWGVSATPCEQNDRCLCKHNLATTTLRTVIINQ